MSDVMLFGVLRMPYDMAMEGEIARHQYWQRGQQAADEIERLQAYIAQRKWECEHIEIESIRADLAAERQKREEAKKNYETAAQDCARYIRMEMDAQERLAAHKAALESATQEIEGWKADQAENLEVTFGLQRQINELKAALEQARDALDEALCLARTKGLLIRGEVFSDAIATIDKVLK